MSLPRKTGKRVIVSAFGETPTDAIRDCMALEDMGSPDPARLAPGEVAIEIRSATVAWVDLLMTSGQYQHMPAPPYCPGMEYSGVVLATGSAVAAADLAVGDRVFADFMLAGPRSGGAYRAAGGRCVTLARRLPRPAFMIGAYRRPRHRRRR